MKVLVEPGPVEFDRVVTVCGPAHRHCSVFPGRTKTVHVGSEAPPKPTQGMPDGEAKLAMQQRVRDEFAGSRRPCQER